MDEAQRDQNEALRAQNEQNLKVIEDLRAQLDAFQDTSRQQAPPPPPAQVPTPREQVEQPPPPRVKRPMVEMYRATEESFRPAITLPPLAAQHFELKASLIRMVQVDCRFSGTSQENPHAHLAHLTQICQTFHTIEVSAENIKLMMFPFSLVGEARQWLNELPADSIHTWAELTREFLRKYHPPSKVAEAMADIRNFTHTYGEELGDAWRRFTQLLRRCPNHGEPWHKLMHYFYNALDWETAEELDRLAEGSFMVLDEQRAQQILNTAATRETTRSDMRRSHKSSTESAVQNQLDEMKEQIALLVRAQNMQAPRVEPPPQPSQDTVMVKSMIGELAELLGVVTTELTAVKAIMAEQGKKIEANAPEVSMHASPLAPVEQVHAITLRSGLSTIDPPFPSHARVEATKAREKELVDISVPIVTPPTKATIGRSDDELRKAKEAEDELYARVPFPQRLRKFEEEKSFQKFVDIFRKLHINIPFVEAISNMPKYARFLKDILSNKKRMDEFATVVMSEECSAVIQRALPQKKKDPGRFVIPVSLGDAFQGKALCDLGASINLMPTSVFRQLGVGEPKPTQMCLQMADRSIKRPRGIIEDVLVRVGSLILPADFVVLDMEANEDVPLILGRPFLATGRTTIDVAGGKLTMRVNEDEIAFDVFHPTTIPAYEESAPCYQVTGTPKERHEALKELIIGELAHIGVKEKEHMLGELQRKRLAPKKPKKKKKSEVDDEEKGSRPKEKDLMGCEVPKHGNLKIGGGEEYFHPPYMDT